MKKLGIFLLFLIFVGGCSSKGKKATATEDSKTNEILRVEVVSPVRRNHVFTKEYNGLFKPFKEANVGSSLPGKVEKIFVPEGKTVQQGEMLAQLSSELLVQAEIEYLTLKKDFQRVSNLYEKNSISQQDYDHVKAQYEAAQAKYEMLKKNTEIRAPFSGVVMKHLVKEGENFFFSPSLDPTYSMTSGIIQLMQIDPLLCVVEVGEKEYSSIRLGQKVEIEPYAFPGKKIEGTVYRFEPLVSGVDRLVRVQIQVPNTLRLLPGMGAKVRIPMEARYYVTLPLEALYTDPLTNKTYVFVSENNKAVKVPVQVATVVGDSILFEDFPLDKKVICTKVKQLKDGQQIEVIQNK